MESYWKQSSKRGNRKKCKYKNKSVFDLFADTDGDGVANVFDCSPRNKKKQDMAGFMSTLGAAQSAASRAIASTAHNVASHIPGVSSLAQKTSGGEKIIVSPVSGKILISTADARARAIQSKQSIQKVIERDYPIQKLVQIEYHSLGGRLPPSPTPTPINKYPRHPYPIPKPLPSSIYPAPPRPPQLPFKPVYPKPTRPIQYSQVPPMRRQEY